MKLVQSLFVVLLSLGGCAVKTLDGGSSGQQASSDAGSGALEGTVGGVPFVPASVSIGTVEFAGGVQWALKMSNQVDDCGVTKAPPTDSVAEIRAIVADLPRKVGEFTIAYADGHGTTFQKGVFEADSGVEPQLFSGTSGTVRFDSWSETTGTVVTGYLDIKGESNAALRGNFTAKVCAPK